MQGRTVLQREGILCRRVTNNQLTISQLFEKGPGRNLKSHIGAFNTQCTLVSNWNPSLKYLSTFHFLTKQVKVFFGVKVDANAAGNNFLRSLDTLEML